MGFLRKIGYGYNMRIHGATRLALDGNGQSPENPAASLIEALKEDQGVVEADDINRFERKLDPTATGIARNEAEVERVAESVSRRYAGKGERTNPTGHHQPQELTVRESGSGPHCGPSARRPRRAASMARLPGAPEGRDSVTTCERAGCASIAGDMRRSASGAICTRRGYRSGGVRLARRNVSLLN